jgi:hypothetical protein
VSVRGLGDTAGLDLPPEEMRRLAQEAMDGALAASASAPQPPRSPRKGVGAAIAAALTRRPSGTGASASLLTALMGGGVERPPRGAATSRPPSPAGESPPSARERGSSQPPAADAHSSQSHLSAAPCVASLELAQLRADLATAVAGLAVIAAGAGATALLPGALSPAQALTQAMAAKDALMEALRCEVDDAKREAAAYKARALRLEEELAKGEPDAAQLVAHLVRAAVARVVTQGAGEGGADG